MREAGDRFTTEEFLGFVRAARFWAEEAGGSEKEVAAMRAAADKLEMQCGVMVAVERDIGGEEVVH